ncbi:molybdenum cofactor biosynthesis protein MoaE [Cyclobacterium marinum]|uniref:Molybdopterin synthase catalytic subunit n=1 Tax=Cyclobacterium marinum (strain ATCC 25205 / DSM 745 / LMG 13164 / NCIMB 1802) TaxID=880070 RepID=G0J847_CYCMS|nr:molybdenum cofactor biosynthesis protein MoaE [Cyclobacterium marinum]AEL27827.1 molybdopterin biosynthesis MoaE protein [Cyclobacterium marinum DSM 745]|tara:strand:+ start:20783 stop:21196 length:414 start_codon:yes stop_codon:yes gene_type:complete
MIHVKLVEKIILEEVYTYLQDPEAGGIDLFIGSVRNHALGKNVLKLKFEAYEPMAISEMKKLAHKAIEKWPLKKVLIVHALGEKQIGEPVVVIGTSSAHRQDAFESCRFLIDTLKMTVPIWKKEYFTDQTVWVNAHP